MLTKTEDTQELEMAKNLLKAIKDKEQSLLKELSEQ